MTPQMLWNEHDGRVTVAVADSKTGDAFAVEVRQGDRAMEGLRSPLRLRRGRPSHCAGSRHEGRRRPRGQCAAAAGRAARPADAARQRAGGCAGAGRDRARSRADRHPWQRTTGRSPRPPGRRERRRDPARCARRGVRRDDRLCPCQELGNALPERQVVTVLTQVVVDPSDPAFGRPSKPIGATYRTREAADAASAGEHWAIAADGRFWRRVVASPEPRAIIELEPIRRLATGGVLVICAGGGGVPVVRTPDGALAGIEAVVDKDLTAALLAIDLGADALLLLTDVGTIRRLEDAPALLAGRAGTTVRMSPPAPVQPPCSTRSSSAAMAGKEAVTAQRRRGWRP